MDPEEEQLVCDKKCDNASEAKRRKLLAELRRKLRRVNSEAMDTDDEMAETEIRAPKKSKTMLGNKIALKQERAIELGWIHEGQQVRKQTGGGTRKVTVPREANAKVIIEHATQLFFPDGVSKRGMKLEDVNLDICDFSLNKASASQTVGDVYEKEKPAGIMRWYLSSTLKSSASKAVKTTPRQAESIPSAVLQIPASTQPATSTSTAVIESSPSGQDSPVARQDTSLSPSTVSSDKESSNLLYPVLKGEVCTSNEPLNISYFREIDSVYSSNKSRITVHSRSQCIYKTVEDGNPADPSVVYDPLRNGYKISNISKGNKTFVSVTMHGDEYEFPEGSQAKSPDPFLILHHPDEVWGIEEGKLVLAIVSQNHNNAGVSYEWFCDGQSVYSGGCVFLVEAPGKYSCVLKATIQEQDGQLKEITRDSNVVQVVKIPQPIPMPSCENSKESGPEQIQGSDVDCDFKSEINHGSFGEVFRGSYKEAYVAVKRIKMKRGKRPDKFILKEATIHQQIAHKNIVKFIGTYMDQTCVYILTEFIDGQNMEDMIYLNDDEVDMPLKKLSVAVGVLEGIAYLHGHDPQIIHQDIKPSNILLDRHLSPKVCDLGLARVRSFDVSSTTSGVHAVGTPEYMSPETLLYSKKGTASSDVWSLGITLLEWFYKRDAWNLQNQDDEPVSYIRHCMQKKQVPHILETRCLPLLVPCISYDPSERPTARRLLNQFQCPTCSNTVVNSLSGT